MFVVISFRNVFTSYKIQKILQGYNKAVHRLFESVGYVLHETEKKAIALQAVQKEKEEKQKEDSNFDTLDQCSEVNNQGFTH